VVARPVPPSGLEVPGDVRRVVDGLQAQPHGGGPALRGRIEDDDLGRTVHPGQ
jgi:hypothetical protein